VLFDLQNARNPKIDAPLMPYVGVFLLGMALDLRLRPLLAQARNGAMATRFFVAGAACVFATVAGVIVWHFAKEHVVALIGNAEVVDRVRLTFSPLSKRPPSPAYLLFYGGAGLLLLAICFARRPAALMDRVVSHASVIGRASLMCFVVQDWIFHLVPRVLGFDGNTSVAFWFAYFGVGLVVLYCLAKAWGRVNGNRYMTIGLKRAMSRARSGAPVATFRLRRRDGRGFGARLMRTAVHTRPR
jgi:hypothetical protein